MWHQMLCQLYISNQYEKGCVTILTTYSLHTLDLVFYISFFNQVGLPIWDFNLLFNYIL